MKTAPEFIIEYVQKLRQNRQLTKENLICMILISFAAFCKISIKEKYDLYFFKYKLQDELNINVITKALDVLFEYVPKKSNDVIVEFIENAPDKIEKGEWEGSIEYLISYLIASPDFSFAEAPEFLNKLCIKLLNPIDGSFYDGASGICSTIIEAKKFSDRLEFYAQEINPLLHSLSVLRTYTYNINCNNILCGDTLSEPKFTFNSYTLKTFDYSVMFPPFGRKIRHLESVLQRDSYNRFHNFLPAAATEEWLFILHQLASLSPYGKAIAVVPSGSLFNAASEYIRESLIRDGHIECIISLPPNILTYTASPLNIVIMNKKKNPNSQILFIRAEEKFQQYKTDYKKVSDSTIDEIVQIYNKCQSISGISRLVPALELEASILLPSRYVTKPIKTKKYGNLFITEPKGDGWVQLKNTGDFYRGVNISVSSKADELASYKIINYTDVQNGELQQSGISSFNLNKNKSYEKNIVYQGDLIISCKGTAIKICVIDKPDEQLLLSANFIGIHIDSKKYDPYFLKYYLESPAGQSFLQKRQVGTSIFMLSAKDIEEIPVPSLTLEEQKKYVNELIFSEQLIYKKIEALYTQSADVKWDFYQKIGLGKIMEKEN